MAQWIFDNQAQTWFDVDTQTALPRGVNPNGQQTPEGFITMQGGDGLYGFNPGTNVTKPLNADFTQDLGRSQGDAWMDLIPYLWLGGAGGALGAGAAATGAESAATGATTGTATTGTGGFTGGLTGTATGAPGFSGASLGAPGVSTAGASGSLAPGFFGAETLVPGSLGGSAALSAGTGATTAAPAAAPAVAAPAAPGAASSLFSNPQVLGAGAGALLGGLGSSGKSGTVQTQEGIPDWLMPYAKPALDRYSTELQNYQTDPFGIMSSAMQEFNKTISGGYLTPESNPYLQDYFRMGSERVKSTLSPSFGHMQAFGANTGYNEALSKGLGDLATTLYGGAYENERSRQQQMIGAAPQFLGQASTANFAPYQQFLSTIGGMGKKKEEPYFTNPFGGALGGAMAGSQLGSIWK